MEKKSKKNPPRAQKSASGTVLGPIKKSTGPKLPGNGFLSPMDWNLLVNPWRFARYL